jgi:hypothetical protein
MPSSHEEIARRSLGFGDRSFEKVRVLLFQQLRGAELITVKLRSYQHNQENS